MEAIIVLSSAVLFRMIVWEHMETYLFMLKCMRHHCCPKSIQDE
jgi:hypothetical protein